MLEIVKMALRVKTDAFDAEILLLIESAIRDMEIAGIIVTYTPTQAEGGLVTDYTVEDALLQRAIVTYCKANFGQPDEFDQLQASYRDQRAQLQYASGYREGIDG